jgi:hypothetical protein
MSSERSYALAIRKRAVAVVWVFVLALLMVWQAQDAEEAVDEETKSSAAAAAATPTPTHVPTPLPTAYRSAPQAFEKRQATAKPRTARVAKIHNCDDVQDKTLCNLNYTRHDSWTRYLFRYFGMIDVASHCIPLTPSNPIPPPPPPLSLPGDRVGSDLALGSHCCI